MGGASRSILTAFSFDIYYGKRRILKDQAFGRLRSRTLKEKFVKEIVGKIEKVRVRDLNRKRRQKELEQRLLDQRRKLKEKELKLKKEIAKRRQIERSYNRKITKERALERKLSFKEEFLLAKLPYMKMREDLFIPYDNRPSAKIYQSKYGKTAVKKMQMISDKFAQKKLKHDQALIELAKKYRTITKPFRMSKEQFKQIEKILRFNESDMPDFNSVYVNEVNEFEKMAKRKLSMIIPFKPRNDVWEKDYIYKFLVTDRGRVPICIYSMSLDKSFHVPVSEATFIPAFNDYIDRIGIYVKAFFEEQEGRFDKWIFRLKFAKKISKNQYIEQGISLARREAKTWPEFRDIVIATYLKLRGLDRNQKPVQNYLYGEDEEVLLTGFTIEAS